MVKSVGDLFINDYSKLKDILSQNKLFCIHAEHKDIIEEDLKKYSLNSWIDHCKIRDKRSEVEAIKEVIKNFFPSEWRSVIVSDEKDPYVLGSYFGSEALKEIKV